MRPTNIAPSGRSISLLLVASILASEAATALTVETTTAASASVSLASAAGNVTCNDSGSTATLASASCGRVASSPNAGDPTVTRGSASSSASSSFGQLTLGLHAEGAISNGGGPRPSAGALASAGFVDSVQFRNLTLPFDEPMLITLRFAISGGANVPAVSAWSSVADGIFDASFTPTFFGTIGGQTSCGLITANSCVLSFIVPNGRGGFVSALAQANAGVTASDLAPPGSAASVDLDFTHTIRLDLVEFRHNGQLLDPSTSRITADSGTLYPLLPVPEPGTALLLGLGLAGLGSWSRAAGRRAEDA